MGIQTTPELGVEVPVGTKYLDLYERASAACSTINLLEDYGLEVDTPSDEDKHVASTLAHAYAESPEKASKTVTHKRASEMTPASLLLVKNVLDEFGHVVVESSVRIRNVVTNKLMLETENPDPRIRLRALEMLGKISDVGLFSEKSEVTVTHQSSEELKETLRKKLSKMVTDEEFASAEDAEIIDVGKELGLNDDQ